MGYEEKLKKEKMKKRAIALGIVAVMGIGGGLFYFALHPKSDDLDISKIKDKSLVNFIMTANKDGNISLINPFSKKKTDDLKLPKGNYEFATSNNYEYMVALNLENNKIYKIEENNGQLNKSELMTLNNINNMNMNDIKKMRTDGDLLCLSFKSNKDILAINIKSNVVKTVTLPKDISAWSIKDNKVLYAYNDTINSIDVVNNSYKSIDVGDKTTGLTIGNDKLLAFNKFGSGLNKSITLKIDSSNLKVDSLIKYENSNIYKINADSNKDSFMALIDNGGNQSLERVSLDGDNKMLSQIPLENKIKLDDNAVGINNYLYNKENNELKIISSDTGIVSYNLDIGDSDYMPISK